MLGIKLTDKSIEDLFRRILLKLSGNDNYVHLYKNEVKDIFNLFKTVHNDYLKFFIELRHNDWNDKNIISLIEKMRIENETLRRTLIVKINLIIERFSEEQIKYNDPFYNFFNAAKDYFSCFEYNLKNAFENLDVKIDFKKREIASIQWMKDHPDSPHPIISTGFTLTQEFAEYVLRIPNKNLKEDVINEGLNNAIQSIRKNWDQLCYFYEIIEKRIKRMIKKGQILG